MADNEAPLRNVGARAQHGSFAHMPGTGPALYRCADCAHIGTERTKFICLKYRDLMGRKGSPIPPHSHSCRYFVLKGEL